MARVVCRITEGARPAEATVEVRDYQGRPEYLRVNRELVVAENGRSYLLSDNVYPPAAASDRGPGATLSPSCRSWRWRGAGRRG